eukprot:m.170559 g.170559  ORF g.170559 m.170559 type:complete len:77 (-) comp14534_c0_seq11:1137-1367(-)
MLQRRVALNNLADAGLKMLQSPAQVSQMRLDLERVDLDAIKRESTWVTDCPPEFVDQGNTQQHQQNIITVPITCAN